MRQESWGDEEGRSQIALGASVMGATKPVKCLLDNVL